MVKSGRMPPDTLDVYLPQFVDQMIQERAVEDAFGTRMGIKVSDEEVLIGIMSVYPTGPATNGKLTSKDQSSNSNSVRRV